MADDNVTTLKFIDNVSGPLKKVIEAMEKAKKQTDLLEKQMRNIGNATKVSILEPLGKSYDSISDQCGKFNNLHDFIANVSDVLGKERVETIKNNAAHLKNSILTHSNNAKLLAQDKITKTLSGTKRILNKESIRNNLLKVKEKINSASFLATQKVEALSGKVLSITKRSLSKENIINIANKIKEKSISAALVVRQKAEAIASKVLIGTKKVLGKAINSNIALKLKDKVISTALTLKEKTAAISSKILIGAKKMLSKEYLKNMAIQLKQKAVTTALAVKDKALAAAQKLLNLAFASNPIGIVIAGIILAIGVIALLCTKVKSVRTFFVKAFSGLGKLVSSMLIKPFKSMINIVISGVNVLIKALNGIHIKIPNWIPGVGGKSFGFNLTPITPLAKGTSNWKGGLAITQEKGGEIMDLPRGTRVYPHDKSIQMARAEGAHKSSSSSISINISKLADKVEVRSDNDIDSIANKLATKLEKIMNNVGKVEFA